MTTTEHKRMLQWADFASNWSATNPVLALGEIGIEQETGRFKVGDGATAWNSLAFFDANLANYTDSTALTKLGGYPVVTPEQFGGSVQAACDTIATAGGGTVQLAATTYTLASTLTLPVNCVIRGAGRGISQVNYLGSGTAVQMHNLATVEQKLDVALCDFTLNAVSATTGINAKGMTYGAIERVEVLGVAAGTTPSTGTVGILVDASYGASVGAWHNLIRANYVTGWDAGVKFTGVIAGGQANENVVDACTINWCTRSVWIDVGDHVTVQNSSLSTSVAGSVGVYVNDARARVLNCRFESTAIGVQVGPDGDNAVIENNAFSSSTAGAIGVQFDAGSQSCELDGNYFGPTLTTKILDNSANSSDGSTCHWRGSGQLVPVSFSVSATTAGTYNPSPIGAGGSQVAPIGRAYEIRGITARSSAARTAGTITVTPKVGGTVSTTLSAVIDGTNTQTSSMWQAMGHDANNGASSLGVQVVVDASWAPTTANVLVTVWIEFTA